MEMGSVGGASQEAGSKARGYQDSAPAMSIQEGVLYEYGPSPAAGMAAWISIVASQETG